MGFSCYSEHTKYGITWDEAEHYCNTNRGHMWSINSHDEFYHIYRRTYQDQMNSNDKPTWFDPEISEHSFIGLRGDKVDI